MRPNRTPSTPLAFALAALAVALACLADPDPRGGGLTPTDPADGREMAPDPKGANPDVQAADTGGPCWPMPCELDELVGVGEKPCPGFGKLWDPINEECRCIGGMVLDDNGGCQFQGVTPGGGGPGNSNGNGATGDIGDPGETDPDEKKLNVTLRCRPGVPLPGDMIECEAKPRNAKGSVAYKWRFAPDPERVPIRDGMTGPVLPTVEVDGTRDSVWGGTVAAGGKVSVQAVDSVRFEHAHVSFAVDDSYTTPVSFNEGAKLTNHLWPGALLGRNANAGGNATVGQMMGGDGAPVYTVASGPNTGYAMVNYRMYSVHRYRQLNKRVEATGPKEIPDGDSTLRHWDYLKSLGYDPYHLFWGRSATRDTAASSPARRATKGRSRRW